MRSVMKLWVLHSLHDCQSPSQAPPHPPPSLPGLIPPKPKITIPGKSQITTDTTRKAQNEFPGPILVLVLVLWPPRRAEQFRGHRKQRAPRERRSINWPRDGAEEELSVTFPARPLAIVTREEYQRPSKSVTLSSYLVNVIPGNAEIVPLANSCRESRCCPFIVPQPPPTGQTMSEGKMWRCCSCRCPCPCPRGREEQRHNSNKFGSPEMFITPIVEPRRSRRHRRADKEEIFCIS